MKLFENKTRSLIKIAAAVLSVGIAHSANSLTLAQSPLFLAQPVKPLVMLNMSNDHQLYFKAYDDYTDLDEDGVPDTSYINDYSYYGYFDSNKCYDYDNGAGRFEPRSYTADYYCDSVDGSWSGNFLNWATMTRIDAVRKILYGGFRSTDGDKDGDTVLERAFLPHDAHSFAKYYNGNDIARLTPYAFSGGVKSRTSGITLCNTTNGSGYSQSVSESPKIRVAPGNYSLWASNERWQCRWGQGTNGNNPEASGIEAYSSSPTHGAGFGDGDEFVARIQVCVSGLHEENCRAYPDGNSKPSGLLQAYGEQGEILFGLITGSYKRNLSGGVLRKNIGNFSDEVNEGTDGTFDNSVSGIVKTLNLLRIHGYNYGNGLYVDCPFGLTGITEGSCSNWGNPQSEIYLESLNYLAGQSAAYNADDTTYITGLPSPGWVDPIGSENYCAALNVIQFNASSSSYDGDAAENTGGLNALGTLDSWTNKVGSAENIDGGNFFVGENGADNDQLCTPKSVGVLADVKGTCPDAPRLGGTYDIAGLAHYARSSQIRSDYNVEPVTTYGVALASATPSVTIPIPGTEQVINILPACQNSQTDGDGNREGNCAIVDFKIVEQNFSDSRSDGKLYINWEAAEQGGDYDSDMWGVLNYSVTSSQVEIETKVMEASSGRPLSFGYVLSGTSNDGYHANSGINFWGAADCLEDGAGHCIVNGARQTYSVGISDARLLQSPLYYAAKWGGYSDDENGNTPSETSIANSEPETYFYAIDPAELEESLSQALEQVAAAAGSASSVATNSTRLGTDTVIYQALFNSADWSGEVRALNLKEDGSVGTTKWTTDNSKFDSPATRDIFTYNNGGVDFSWANLSSAQQQALGATEAEGADVINWVRGQDVTGLRDRSSLLGDIVNSSPVFAGRKKYNFDMLPEELGGLAYEAYFNSQKANRREVLYVGANDGMLHAFDAASGEEQFAYIPSGVYEQLKKLSSPDYGSNANPHAYSMDGKLFVGDAYINGAWKNILVGSLGAGGRGIFALDITSPDGFDENDVLFELTDADFPEIGNITGELIIAPTNDGWKLIFGNGYNSENTRARLFAVDLENPLTETQVIEASDAGSNGLAGPALLTNGDGEVVTAYAGDLLGNMWKFDLSANNASNWDVAFGNGGNKDPFFTAVDPNGKVQPITATPTLGLNSQMSNAIMVYFGTGSYLTSSDNATGDVINSFYALADQDAEISDRTELMQKSISSEANGVRDVADNSATSWWTNKKGWYLDLSLGGAVTGERVISKPLLVYDRLLFPTMITSSDPCSFGGSGWLMELVAVGDRYEGHSIFGEDGLEVDYAVISYSEIIRSGEKAYLPTSNIKGELDVEEGDFPIDAVGRMSWRQLR